MTPEAILETVAGREGHFLLESGHHGGLWLELELLCLKPRRVKRFAVALAERLSGREVDVVCGPLNEGAFVALMVAEHLEAEFCYAERFEREGSGRLFPVEYRLPGPLRAAVRGKRVALVNDVISAGSAVRGAYTDLLTCGANPIAIAALLVLGESAERFAEERGVPLITLAHRPYAIWPPDECPMCAAGRPLRRPECSQR